MLSWRAARGVFVCIRENALTRPASTGFSADQVVNNVLSPASTAIEDAVVKVTASADLREDGTVNGF